MSKAVFVLALHHHQPVGNFGIVFEQAFEKCYEPILAAVERHPAMRICLHYTGPLLDWFEQNRPNFLDRVRDLARRGQVEIMGGGFYEPMLSVLPDRDAAGQLKMMSDFCRKRFGKAPAGMWLAERVWEPDVARAVASAGLRYTLVDDTHFRHAGLLEERLRGYYVSEKAGAAVAIFPIDKGLRYTIPFREAQETIAYLKEVAGQGGGVVTYGDDAEKFGVWPGTYKWVFEQGWLEKFFTALEQSSSFIEMAHFSEVLDRCPASGRIYLPTASYDEMMEWALPPEAGHRYLEFKEKLKSSKVYEQYRPFVTGGIWQGFLAKYPEANNIHKKMLLVSAKVERAAEDGERRETVEEARRLLYMGQCNCPYWHGLFGGLYLNYLRHAVYDRLIAAENMADDVLHRGKNFLEVSQADFDADFRDEILVSTKSLNAYIDPAESGSIFELDYRPSCFNLLNTMARRPETYHAMVHKASQIHEHSDEFLSIHEILKVKEPGLERLLRYDRFRRSAFVDHLLAADSELAHFLDGSATELADLGAAAFRVEGVERKGETAVVRLAAEAQGLSAGRSMALNIEKKFTFRRKEPSFSVEYLLNFREPLQAPAVFAPEVNFTLLAADDEKRYFELPHGGRDKMESAGAVSAKEGFAFVDEHFNFRFSLQPSIPSSIWRYPIYTVSQSEDGFEKTYQGSTLLLTFPVPAGTQSFAVRIEARFLPFRS